MLKSCKYKIKKRNFWAGVHPPDEKHLAAHKVIEVFVTPKVVTIPLSQHIGAPAKCVVTKGAYVKVGQTIGEAAGFISSIVHSSVSGEVKEIKTVLNPLGHRVQAVVLENDEKYESDISFSKKEWHSLEKEEIVEIIKNAGIVGMGGATFPTHIKFSPPPGKTINTLIINAVECEPYLNADNRLIQEKTAGIVEGIKILMKAANTDKCIVGIEADMPEAINAIIKETQNFPIEIQVFEVKYPQGAEKQLIYAATKKEVPSGGLPTDVGVVVVNIATAFAVYEAVVKNKPLFERVVTVTGSIVKSPSNFLVRVGTPVADLLEHCGVDYSRLGKVIVGGPMMGQSLFTLDYPITKGFGGVLVLSEDEISYKEEYPCISCGRCIDACPIGLMPTVLAKASRKNDFDTAKDYSATDCIECGACSFICPSRINLLQHIKLAKMAVIKKSKR